MIQLAPSGQPETSLPSYKLLPLLFKKKDGKVLHGYSVEPLVEDPRKDEKHTNHKGQSVKVEDGMKVQPLMPPIKPAGKMIPSRHEVWITTYHEAETSNPFYKKFGLDMPCGLRCKEGSLVLPLYGGNLNISLPDSRFVLQIFTISSFIISNILAVNESIFLFQLVICFFNSKILRLALLFSIEL